MSLEEYVKAMIISEFPLDSVIASSKQSKDARKGIVEYVKHEKPDAIFVDGLVSRIRYPEAYIDGIIESDPLKKFMDVPFQLASQFLNDLKKANPSTEIYMTFSDADEDNIRRLTKYTALKEIRKNEAAIEGHRNEIKGFREKIKRTKDKKVIKNLKNRISDYESKVGNIQKKAMLRMPNSESVEWREFRTKTSKEYLNKLKASNPGVNIQMGNISTEVKGYSFEYAHNYHKESDIPLKSRTNRLVSYVDKLHKAKVPLPHFLIESGHHGETMTHTYKHGDKDVYSLVCSGMVMEDQKIVNGILRGKFKPEIFQGKVNKLEACKRQSKKIPAPGISTIGANNDGYFAGLYTMDHLANVGKGYVKPKDMEFETIVVLSDIHVGKGAVEYGKLESAIDKMVDEIRERKKAGLSAPILFMLNESLQGSNYRTFPVETRRDIPPEQKRQLEALVKKYINPAKPKNLDEAMKSLKEHESAIEKIIEKTIHTQESLNETNIDNQVKWFHDLTKKLIPLTLLYCEYKVGVLFAEGTHIKHTVGEYGIREVDFQSMVYDVLDGMIPVFIEAGELKKDTKLKNMKGKIKKGTEMKFDLKLGEVNYKVSAVHKPGGASPSSNIPMNHIRRTNTMADESDVFFSAHLHTPYFFAEGRMESNDISAYYKGATFNAYDSYGKDKGWGPAVVGYEKALLPKNKKGKGVYKVQFILSDVL